MVDRSANAPDLPGLGDHGHGHGVFQCDDRHAAGNTPLTLYMADNSVSFSALMVGQRLMAGSSYWLKRGYGVDLAMAASVRDYNGGLGSPADLDNGTANNAYVSRVLTIALNCFP